MAQVRLRRVRASYLSDVRVRRLCLVVAAVLLALLAPLASCEAPQPICGELYEDALARR